MTDSIHAARWINQLNNRGWDIHLFPVESHAEVNPELREVTVHQIPYRKRDGADPSVRIEDDFWPLLGRSWPLSHGSYRASRVLERVTRRWKDNSWALAQTIRRLQPDIVHSLEFQHAGYLVLDAKRHVTQKWPPWAVTNWGSDIYLFGRLQAHAAKIRSVLSACDYYGCECQRDVELARSFGLKGEVLPVLPNAGGYDIERLQLLWQPGRTSDRRLILLKGYQSWAGRALVGLRAIELCADLLQGYRVAIYLPTEDVKIAAALLSQSTGIPVEIVPRCSHEDILRLHGKTRISIGLSISDAISTSLLEAMIMGSFPIQSRTSCADEWIRCGETGFLVEAEDPAGVARALRRALTEDALVDRAAETNARVTKNRIDYSVVQPQVVALYERIAERNASSKRV